MQIIVVGCGVVGLTSSIRLLEAGHQVAIWARDLPPNTTSNIAAAIWYPYKAYPEDRVTAWGQRSFDVLCELAQVPETGVQLLSGIELLDTPAPDPWWRSCVRTFRRAAAAELPAGYVDGYVFEAPIIEMPIHLPYLMRRCKELGGSISQREVRSLEEPLQHAALVVNCSGLGARSLAGDSTLYPIRGQITRVSRPALDRFLLDDDPAERRGITYIVPRSADCILGGTAEPDSWSLEVDAQTAASIFERCLRLAPQLAGSQVLEQLVGLRPGRPAVRLEAEALAAGGLVIHNYGHGGAGVTLSWGCAEEVVALVGEHAGS